jgi:hypothetical protein
VALPGPRIGSLIWFQYLWSRDADAGEKFGRKLRRCLVLNKVERSPGGPVTVIVAPITHRRPVDSFTSIEISATDAAALRLDSDVSWIIVDDINYFTWIGPDVELDPSSGTYEAGFIAPVLFQSVIEKFAELKRLGRAKLVARDDKPATGRA